MARRRFFGETCTPFVVNEACPPWASRKISLKKPHFEIYFFLFVCVRFLSQIPSSQQPNQILPKILRKSISLPVGWANFPIFLPPLSLFPLPLARGVGPRRAPRSLPLHPRQLPGARPGLGAPVGARLPARGRLLPPGQPEAAAAPGVPRHPGARPTLGGQAACPAPLLLRRCRSAPHPRPSRPIAAPPLTRFAWDGGSSSSRRPAPSFSQRAGQAPQNPAPPPPLSPCRRCSGGLRAARKGRGTATPLPFPRPRPDDHVRTVFPSLPRT